MNQPHKHKLSSKVLEKAISASIKQEIAVQGINTTTRKGNKELKFLTSKIANYPFRDIEQAQVAGAKLGQHLAEIFQKRGKKNLDAGIIQQVFYQKELFSLAGLSTQMPPTISQKEDLTVVESQQSKQDELVNEETSSVSENLELETNPEVQTNDNISPSSENNSPDILKTNEEFNEETFSISDNVTPEVQTSDKISD